jgi:para-aminobenzoate synthetase
MKGTVKKTPDMTLEKATEILNTPKEMGENLMIADLIRHDMSSLCGSGNVEVVRAMEVEDHTLVYQLITHVRGFSRAHPPILREQHDHRQHLRSGNDHHALLECLPPGSMTGAPKKRSCEILERIEGRQRSIYSGAMGFFDVGGGGNFSVLIRTAFSLSSGKDGLETWRIGAGGAITALSTAQGEWYEMITKLDTVVAIFRPSKGLEAAQCRSHPSSPMFCCGCSDLATPASSDVAGYSSRLKPGDDSSSAGYGSSATSDSGADMPV